MALETTKIEGWLYSVLSGDSGSGGLSSLVNGRIYPYLAPQKPDLPYPIVIYEFRSGRDVQGLGTQRTLLVARYRVRVISKGGPTDRERQAADRIDFLVGHALNQTFDGYVFNAYRANPVTYDEMDSQTQQRYRHLGGDYVVETYPA